MKTCDRCKKTVEERDIFEYQEFYHIDFTGGYASVFGDMNRVQADLCQQCLKELIDSFARKTCLI